MEIELYKAMTEECCILPIKKILLDIKDVNMKNHLGETVLETVLRIWLKTYRKYKINGEYITESNIVKAVQLLIDAGADLNSKNCGRSVIENLLSRLYQGRKLFEVLEILIKAGADANAKDNYGSTVLHLAAQDDHNQVGIVRFLLQERGVDIEMQDPEGFTALQKAVQKENIEVVEYLIDSGADISRVTPRGYTLLHLASETANVNLIKYFLNRGFDINVRSKAGETPLHSLFNSIGFDIKESFIEALEYLLSCTNADINVVTTSSRSTPVHYFINTIVYYASQFDSEDWKSKSFFKILKILIKYKADFRIKNRKSVTPIDLLFTDKCSCYVGVEHKIILLETFIKYGLMDVDTLFTPKNYFGYRTILNYSCSSLKYEMIKFLVKCGVSVDEDDNRQMSPLLNLVDSLRDYNKYVSEWRNKIGFKIIDYFLSLNPSINIITHEGYHILNLDKYEQDSDFDDYPLGYPEFLWKALIEFIRKKQSTGYRLHNCILQTISEKIEYQSYLDKCTAELEILKETKFSSTPVNLYNLLMDPEKKLDHYAKNKELIKDFNDLPQKYPVYGPSIFKKFSKVMENQELREKSAVVLSTCLPCNFDPTHLVINKIISYMKKRHLRYLFEPLNEEIRRKLKFDEFKIAFDKFICDSLPN